MDGMSLLVYKKEKNDSIKAVAVRYILFQIIAISFRVVFASHISFS